MCISFCHPYSGKDLGNLQCVSACSSAIVTEFLEQYQCAQKEDRNIQSSSDLALDSALFRCWRLGVRDFAYSLDL